MHYLLKMVIFQFAMLIYLGVLDMFGPIHELGSETSEVFHGTFFFFQFVYWLKSYFHETMMINTNYYNYY